jgi:sugar phosphate isomerase/epimerase
MLIPRRKFLAALPLCSVAASACAGMAAGTGRGVRIGCQTNAWRIDPADFAQVLAVLDKLKALGFEGFETGFRNLQSQFASPARARAQLEQTGLVFFGTHIFLDQYDPQTGIAPFELIRKTADGAASLGAQRLILSGAGLISDGRVDAEKLKRKAEGLNAAARYCKTRGLRLAYHNHGPEFQTDGLEIEGLYRMTDPALVDFLTDCGWAFRAGMNVPQFFARHHRRIIGLHLRDFKNDEQVPLGQGDFPLRELAEVIRKVKWNGWALNEEERLSGAKPGESAVAPARATLRQVFGK